MKICSCGRPVERWFARSKCKLCHSKLRRQRYATDPEVRRKAQEYQAAYRARKLAAAVRRNVEVPC